ncbi:MAG: hypothetical protein ACFBZ9_17285 [Sphingomonadales bacterium]
MTEDVEALLYVHVARDLRERFGAHAYLIAEEARASLDEVGDEMGEAIWSEITRSLGAMDMGLVSSSIH